MYSTNEPHFQNINWTGLPGLDSLGWTVTVNV